MQTLSFPASEWRAHLESRQHTGVERSLCDTYGENEECVDRRRKALTSSLQLFARNFPERQHANVFVARAPGRINLRGMHIDTHGGAYNAIAIDREVVLVVSPNAVASTVGGPCTVSASRVVIVNTQYTPSRLEFDLDTDSDADARSWTRYVQLALRVLAKELKEKHDVSSFANLGFHAVIQSDIPAGAGLSSSHALILNVFVALLATHCMVNGVSTENDDVDGSGAMLLGISKVRLIELSKQVEGLAGAVTGLGDQGAILFARKSLVVHARFFQENLHSLNPRYVPLPRDHVLVVADSLSRRDLAGSESRDYAFPRFGYSVALGLLKDALERSSELSSLSDKIERLEHVNPTTFSEHGGVASIYGLMKVIPERSTVENLIATYPSLEQVIQRAKVKNFPVAKDGTEELEIGEVELRGALLYGIAECERARRFFGILSEIALLDEGLAKDDSGGDDDDADDDADDDRDRMEERLAELGHLMNTGHRGDSRACIQRLDDEHFDELIQANSRLEHQPGEFRASLPDMDVLQANLVEGGARGACLTGAGLGGVIIGLVHKNKVDEVCRHLRASFYSEKEESPIHVVYPVAGVNVL